MCDTPKTYKQAVARIKELSDTAATRKKTSDDAAAKVTVAKKLIIDNKAAATDEASAAGYLIDADGFDISVSKARATKKVDIVSMSAVKEVLDGEEEGLADELMTFSIADLEEHLSPRQLEKLVTSQTSYGSRTVTVKKKAV